MLTPPLARAAPAASLRARTPTYPRPRAPSLRRALARTGRRPEC